MLDISFDLLDSQPTQPGLKPTVWLKQESPNERALRFSLDGQEGLRLFREKHFYIADSFRHGWRTYMTSVIRDHGEQVMSKLRGSIDYVLIDTISAPAGRLQVDCRILENLGHSTQELNGRCLSEIEIVGACAQPVYGERDPRYGWRKYVKVMGGQWIGECIFTGRIDKSDQWEVKQTRRNAVKTDCLWQPGTPMLDLDHDYLYDPLATMYARYERSQQGMKVDGGVLVTEAKDLEWLFAPGPQPVLA